VHYAHQRLVIHRDIKPANVLLREDGRPVLLDFGIAKLLDPERRQGDQTQPWFTPAYASPEQRRGEAVSTATDVHALGLLLYELLTDRAPATDGEGRLPVPSRALSGRKAARVRGDLDRIVMRATAPEPVRRYASAEALAEDIERYLAGRPVHAVPDSVGYRSARFLQRHPFGVLAVLAALAMLSVLGWRVVDERDRALQAEAAAQRESRAAEAVTSYLIGLFGEADPGRARGGALTPVELVDRGRARLDQREDLPARERARLLATLGELYTNLGQPVKATDALEAAVATSDAPGIDAGQRANYMALLGAALDRRAEYGAAERAYAQALALVRKSGTATDSAVLQAEHALMLSRQGRLTEAEPLMRRAIAARATVFGRRSSEAAEAKVYLAELLRTGGRHDEAMPLMTEAIADLRGAFPPDHEELLSALGLQAELLREFGDTDAAEQVLLEILSHRETVLERDSEQIALVHSALGSVYYEQGRTREATEQFVAALEIGERTFKSDDPTLAIDLNNAASLYEEQGDYAAAAPLFRRALLIMEGHPVDHLPRLVQFRQNLGRLLMLAGSAEEARRLLEMPIPGTGDTADLAVQRGRQRLHLAEWHRRYGTPAEATRWLDELEANVEDIGGREVPRYAQALRTRALLQVAAGERREAMALLEQARILLVEGRGERYVGVGELAMDLAAIALDEGRREDARRWLTEARSILPPVVAPRSPQAATLRALDQRLATP
jgi:serine/threonine-protein kinase